MYLMSGPVQLSSQAYASTRSGKSSPLMSSTTLLLITQFCTGLEANNCGKLHKGLGLLCQTVMVGGGGWW